MALNSYSTEPATRGKVILHTTLGPLDVELWPKEAPKACRNFVQLCLERYFDGLPFHRVIKDFMVQTGDPTGTGSGGESIYGAPFEDEFHGRLRFTHRGLVAMANSAPHSNGSQFFITLDRCDWLDKRHTIFGKVTGTSIYNLNRFNELELHPAAAGAKEAGPGGSGGEPGGGGGDRPLHPPLISSTEVLFDPFDDIVPRQIVHRNPAQLAAEEAAREAAAKKEARRPKRARNTKLLSFGEEEEEAAEADARRRAGGAAGAAAAAASATGRRSKSVHDVLSNDPRLSRALAVEDVAQPPPPTAADAADGRAHGAEAQEEGSGGPKGGDDDASTADGFAARMRRQQLERREMLAARGAAGSGPGRPPPPPPLDSGREHAAAAAAAAAANGGPSRAPPPPPPPSEYERLKQELVRSTAAAQSTGWRWRGKGNVPDSDDEDDDDAAPGAQNGGAGNGAVSTAADLEARRARFLSKSRQLKALGKKDRAKETALRLQMFTQSAGKAGLVGHALAPPPKLMAEGTDDMYETTDPLEAAGDAAAHSRAMRKIAERQAAGASGQLSMRAAEGDPEWRTASADPPRELAAPRTQPAGADEEQVDYDD